MRKWNREEILLLFLSLLLPFFSLSQSNKEQWIKYLTNISKDRPQDRIYLTAPDSTGYRTPLKVPKNIEDFSRMPSTSSLIYPILFIHGLDSNSDTWNVTTDWMDNQYGFIYGGRIDYCLNFDGNNSVANTNFYPNQSADIAQFLPILENGDILLNPVADYYYLNFDVGLDGSVLPQASDSNYAKSNQAAIAKQGMAIKDAIEVILTLTGKSKVVLFGHSMGGLASRDYLQNPSKWQADGQHHVAKLITTGSPHGGSNFGFGALSSVVGIDEGSEAVRDLRTSYFWSGDDGRYLFGGTEIQNFFNMNDSLFYNFDNVDINCNGSEGDNVTGLNQKQNPTNLDYACIIGQVSGTQSDGVVTTNSADLSNFIDFDTNIVFNKFYHYTNAPLGLGHLELTDQNFQNMQGLDVPNEYALSYDISLNKNYMEFITQQPTGGYTYDYDDYKFTILENGNYTLNINNSSSQALNCYILDNNLNILLNTSVTANDSEFSTQIFLNSGQYFLEFEGITNANSYLNPYSFSIEETLSNQDNNFNVPASLYPNPANSMVYIKSEMDFETAEIYNGIGQQIMMLSLDSSQKLNLNRISSGVYTLILKTKTHSKVLRLIKK